MQMTATITQQAGGAQASLPQDYTETVSDKGEACELAGSHILCRALVREGVKLLYGYPGGAIMPFYDALTAYPTLHHVLVRHEQAAAHAADGRRLATSVRRRCPANAE